jgi:uridine kinase
MGDGTSGRAELLERLAELLSTRRPSHPLRVAVDGPDAAGKTMLADELATLVQASRPVIRAGVDDFHNRSAVRRQRGELSPDGYLADSFDVAALQAGLLSPLGPGGDRRYRVASFDYRADRPVAVPVRSAPADAVLLLDGVFLLRSELRACWDLSIFLTVTPEEVLRRASVRDLELFGGATAVRERYLRRYLPAQQLYADRDRPRDVADIVIDNEDPARPVVVKWPAPHDL